MPERPGGEGRESRARERTPPIPGIGAPAPFALVASLLLASLVAFVASAVAFLAAADALARGALADPAVLLAVHLLTLGFLPLAVAGAALHVLPVFLRVPPRPAWGWAALAGLCAGPFLAVAVARHAQSVAWPAAALFGLGLAALLGEVGRLVRTAPRGKLLVVSRLGIAAAGLAGLLSMLGGVVLFSVRWRPWAGIPHDRLIAIHLHLALVGCLTLLVVTVGRTLGPMLALAPAAPRRRIPLDELLLVVGTWLVVAGLAAGSTALVVSGLLPTLLALGRFAWLIVRTARTRRTSSLEAPLGHLLVGLAFLAQAAALAVIVVSGRRDPEVLAAYALLALLGWAAGVTVGHVGRLLALSAWTWWPPGERPKQAAFVDHVAWRAELIAFAAGVELLAVGALAGDVMTVRTGGVLLVAASLLGLAGALRRTWPRAAGVTMPSDAP